MARIKIVERDEQGQPTTRISVPGYIELYERTLSTQARLDAFDGMNPTGPQNSRPNHIRDAAAAAGAVATQMNPGQDPVDGSNTIIKAEKDSRGNSSEPKAKLSVPIPEQAVPSGALGYLDDYIDKILEELHNVNALIPATSTSPPRVDRNIDHARTLKFLLGMMMLTRCR
jgi:hypothetical protein